MKTFEQCVRCYDHTSTHTMSMFNEDLICIPCKEKERKHPKYKEAADVERQACLAGNMNFKWVGKPADL